VSHLNRALAAFILIAIGLLAYADGGDGLVLPPGFSAEVVFAGDGPARHFAIRDNGDIYVTTQLEPFTEYSPERVKGVLALRDTDKDGRIDQVEQFSKILGTGIRFYRNMLYVSDHRGVYRFRFQGNELVPSGPRETVLDGFPDESQHADKTFAFDGKGRMYVNVGGPSNACQEQDRAPESPGLSPCPLLERAGGIWVFDALKLGQKPADGVRYATGVRNAVAIEWSRAANALFVVIHGRDQLDTNWPQFFTAEDNAETVAEEMHIVRPGSNLGWPYTYFDVRRGQRMIAPEYGGDGKTPAPTGMYADPIVAFPAHWAPGDLLFYTGRAFPSEYRNGAFIAFHGSWNRAPLPQSGYNISFVPLKKDVVAGPWRVFADNFAHLPLPDNHPANAAHRPIGLAQDKKGALYVMDSKQGKIWRITYDGAKKRRPT